MGVLLKNATLLKLLQMKNWSGKQFLNQNVNMFILDSIWVFLGLWASPKWTLQELQFLCTSALLSCFNILRKQWETALKCTKCVQILDFDWCYCIFLDSTCNTRGQPNLTNRSQINICVRSQTHFSSACSQTVSNTNVRAARGATGPRPSLRGKWSNILPSNPTIAAELVRASPSWCCWYE